MGLNRELFDTFAGRIVDLPEMAQYHRSHLLSDNFLIHHDGCVKVHYAPFDHVNSDACVILMGITPGWTQMEIGYREAWKALQDGNDIDTVCSRAKGTASFAGSMRSNLISMLDGIKLHQALGIRSTSALFGADAKSLHTTSVLRYPVFVDDENYNGHRPSLLTTDIFRKMARLLLLEEIRQIPNALIVPLGASVGEVVRDLSVCGLLDERRWLNGFPHPSGGNGHRKRQFIERQADLTRQVERWHSSTGNGDR